MAVGLSSTLERSRRVAGLEELPAPKTGLRLNSLGKS
jgi:hypothetical protein